MIDNSNIGAGKLFISTKPTGPCTVRSLCKYNNVDCSKDVICVPSDWTNVLGWLVPNVWNIKFSAGKTFKNTFTTSKAERVISFDPKDVATVARALLDTYQELASVVWDLQEYECSYCYGSWGDHSAEIHAPDCPVLMARDLLTGLGEV